MAEDRNTRFRGGKQKRRDAQYGISDPDFWRWWHRVGKDFAGGFDLASRNAANAMYQEWIGLGRPQVK